MMNSEEKGFPIKEETRRQFFRRGAQGLGLGALATLLRGEAGNGLPGIPHFPPRAKSIIYMHMVGGPPQMDLFDYKPQMKTGTTRICRRASARASASPQ